MVVNVTSRMKEAIRNILADERRKTMNLYQVNMSDGHVSFEFKCYASNFTDAMNKAKEAHPGVMIDGIFLVKED